MATSFFDLTGDSSGEGLGDGLADGEVGYSGDSTDLLGEVTLGSSIALAPSSNALDDISIADGPSGFDSLSLSGVSDAAPNALDDIAPLVSLDDAQLGGYNGGGSADSSAQHPAGIQSSADTTDFLSTVKKYGFSIGSLFARGMGSPSPTVSPGYGAMANPNVRPVQPVSTTFMLVALLAVGALGFAILGGGE